MTLLHLPSHLRPEPKTPEPRERKAPVFDEFGSCVATVTIPDYLADQVQRMPSPFMRVDITREALTELESQLGPDKRQALLVQRRKHVMIQIGLVPCGEHIAWLFRVLPSDSEPPNPCQLLWSDLDVLSQDSLLTGIVDTVKAMFSRMAN